MKKVYSLLVAGFLAFTGLSAQLGSCTDPTTPSGGYVASKNIGNTGY